MIKKLKLAFVALSITISSNAQNQTFEWAKQIAPGGFHNDTPIDVDASGNTYITGVYNGTIDFDPGPNTFNLMSSNAGSMYILKLDASGNFVWAKDVSGSFYISGLSIKLDNSANIYITGNYNGTVDFDPSAATYTIGSSTSQTFVLKLDASGNFVWAKSMYGGTGNAGYAIDVDASGNVYTTGGFKGTTDFDPGVGTANLASTGVGQDVFVWKLDVNGNYVWAKKFGNTGDDYAHSIAVDASGNVYTTGQFTTTVDFDPGAGIASLTSFGNDDTFISKLDVNGNYVWAKQLGGTSYDWPRAMTVDNLGNVYTIGYTTSSDGDFNPSSATYTLSAGGYISKLNTNGGFIWARQIPVTYYSGGITLDAINNIYITGLFSGTTDLDPGIGTFNLTSLGNTDACILKLDNNSNFLWAKQLGGTLEDFGAEIVVDASNNIYTTGSFNGTSDFNLGSTSYSLTAIGPDENKFIHKLGQCSPPATPTITSLPASLEICSNHTAVLSATSTGTVNWYTTPTGTIVLASGSSYTTSVLATGTYTYYAEASTCTVSATRAAITITVNATPTITANSGSICSGNSFTISPGGASTYTISGGAFVVNPTTNSSYTITGQSTNGCINTAVATVTVNSTVIPTISISTPSTSICGSSAAFSSTITNGGSAPTYQWKKNGTNVGSNINTYSPTGLVNGDVIYCELTSNLSCTSPTAVSSNSIAITVNSFVIPTILISTPSNTICGSSAAFSSTITNGGTAPTYQWKKNGNNVGSNISSYSPTSLQNGDILSCWLTSNFSCASPTVVSSNSITITANPTPTVTVSSSNTLICVGETASLTANGAATYSWSSGSTGSNIVVSPGNTTTYTVTGTTSAGCSATSSFTQTVNLCTTIEQFTTNLFNVYPNPSHGVFTMYLSSEATITIVNVLGELIYTNNLDKGNHIIDLFEQPNGIYFMQVQTNSANNQLRLLKTN